MTLLVGIKRRTPLWATTWSFGQVGIAILYWLSSREVYLRVVERYPKLGRMGNIVFAGATVVAISMSIWLLRFEPGIARLDGWLPMGYATRRVGALAAFLFCWLSAAAYSAIRIPGRRNMRMHFVLFSSHALLTAASQSAINILGKQAQVWADFALITSALVLYCCWIFLMRRDGEMVPPAPSSEEGEEAHRDAEDMLRSLKPPRGRERRDAAT